MADHHDRAGEFEQRVFERAQGFHVQVVGRFIEHQHVAAGNQCLGQVQASAFTAREHAHALLLVGAVEVEAACIGAAGHGEPADSQHVQAAGDVFPDGFLVGQIVAVLVHKGHSRGLADHDFAAVRLFFTANQFEQRRFTGTVGADDADDSACRNFEAQVVDQEAVAKRLAHALEFDDLIAQALGHGNENLLRLIALLVFKVRQFLEAGQARLALGLARLGVLA